MVRIQKQNLTPTSDSCFHTFELLSDGTTLQPHFTCCTSQPNVEGQASSQEIWEGGGAVHWGHYNWDIIGSQLDKGNINLRNSPFKVLFWRRSLSSDRRTSGEKRRIAMRRRRRSRSYSRLKIQMRRQNKSSESLLSSISSHSHTEQVEPQAGEVRQAAVWRDDDRPLRHGECHPWGRVWGRDRTDDEAWSSSISYW